MFAEHARLAYELAQLEIGSLDLDLQTGNAAAEGRAIDDMVVGTVVFGAAFLALRTMAHEHESRRLLFSADAPPDPTPPAP